MMHARFAKWVESQGMTQKQVAQELEVDRTAVAHILAGRRNPGLRVAFAIEKLTGGKLKAQDWTTTTKAA